MILLAANDNGVPPSSPDINPNGFIQLPPDEILLQPYVIQRMALVIKNLMNYPQREMSGEIAELIWNYQGKIYRADGSLANHSNVDPWYIFGCDEDPSSCWWSAFKRRSETAPTLMTRKLAKRFQLIYLAIMIKHPQIGNRLF